VRGNGRAQRGPAPVRRSAVESRAFAIRGRPCALPLPATRHRCA
jgi:hypothetical protein